MICMDKKKPTGGANHPAGRTDPAMVRRSGPIYPSAFVPPGRSAKVCKSRQFAFNRALLPHPADYYVAAGLVLQGRGAWRSALCPFHLDTRPSLRVHAESGAFRCMVCGVKGRDVLAFHMQRHELDFVEAAVALGAWEAK